MSDAAAGGPRATSAPAPPGIDAEGVARFFAAHVEGGDVPLVFSFLSGGRSNLTYRVEAGGRVFVLRRPPLGHVLPTAHDVAREYRVLSALRDTGLPVPRTRALCEDASVTGAPFYVMDFVPGVVIEEELPAGYATTPAERRRIGEGLMRTLAALHALDWRALGLAGFGRPEGYLARQVRRWSEQWERSKASELPLVSELIRRLNAALPETAAATLVHGDWRLGNLALDPADPGRVAAIFDWEMATLGDPLADVGYTLVYWGEPGDAKGSRGPGGYAAVTAQPGFHTRAELVAEYERASGRDVAAIEFYEVLALYKLAVISEGAYARWRAGLTAGEGFERVERVSVALCEAALAIAERSWLPGLRGR
jgi:aminoglycoside phosphotransferase (APT) family kinase protein